MGGREPGKVESAITAATVALRVCCCCCFVFVFVVVLFLFLFLFLFCFCIAFNSSKNHGGLGAWVPGCRG